MSTYTIVTTKGRRTADSIGNALRTLAEDGALSAAICGPSITRDDTDETISFDILEYDAISVEAAQDLLELAGGDPFGDDADGFHWPYAPSLREVADAMDAWEARHV